MRDRITFLEDDVASYTAEVFRELSLQETDDDTLHETNLRKIDGVWRQQGITFEETLNY